MTLPKAVTIIEVGPRDGLQNEKQFVPTEAKITFINLLKQAGFTEMEVTSFVSPKWVPQMKDAKEVVSACSDSLRNIVLAPNQKGVELAKELHCQAVAVFVGVSNTFNKKNINKTTKESMQELVPIIQNLKEENTFVRACISTSFYCPYEGKMKEEDTIALCKQFVEAGVDELSVADTIGMANPKDVYSLFLKLNQLFPEVLLTAHFHDTRGMAIANIYAALQAGTSRFDSSAGGLGGCPFAKGATGNVATEDVVFMLHEMGIETNIDSSKLLEAVSFIAPYVSRKIDSKHFALKPVSLQ
ncbi:hydroxymethylglutaryl-CoA lyase [Metabacillus iocasae]|uniref:Hydroxymethylglutaryl-CoA lyase n=1 Tax=Priestia iocasae TaxID=2291674 RepID=A0ABS2QQ99_9BACI|nr:hydroxymethylglutaryl-CoA lyase [Metabacillus iocasae]MBM7701638.1 hydroxymethylglutaryl-CoA lyase [Metabacillus iocasae]